MVDGSVASGSQVQLTFGGSKTKEVAPGEQFWSDPVALHLPAGHLLAFTWTLSAAPGASIPYNTEQMLVSAYDAPGQLAGAEHAEAGFKPSANLLVLPAFIGYARQVRQRLVFLGDSITQGVRTRQDGYEYWVARIADGLGPDYGVWNLGSGWARAYDASANAAWLHKAKLGLVPDGSDALIMLALGVNDLDIGARTAEELLEDLTMICSLLRAHAPAAKIVLFTVPPFNFREERESRWRKVNEVLRRSALPGVDRVFDMAALLSMPEPEAHLERREFMSSADDPHPNGHAGQVVSEAFLAWARDSGLIEQ